jgi:hypothetical protein
MFKHIIVNIFKHNSLKYINGKLLKWLKDYISERKQQVLLNNSISSLGTLKAGVPQGSVLGLLLLIYCIYVLPK